MRAAAPPLVPILRSAAQGRLLALLATDPERSYGLRELAAAAGTSPMTAQREVDRADQAHVVVSHYEGRNRRVRINREHFLFEPLRRLLLAAFGAPQVVAEEFADVSGAQQVVVYGSWVARYFGEQGPPPHDVDVLVIGDEVDREQVDAAADRAERRLGLPVQATVRTSRAWAAVDDPFLTTVRDRPRLTVLHTPEDQQERQG